MVNQRKGKEEMKKKFSIVIPIYKNEENLPITIPYIMDNLKLFPDYDVEIIMVCDGSPDASYMIMKEYKEKYPEVIKIAKLTRNWGQGAAIHCGFDMAEGEVIGVISADMQDPFELFVDMLKEWEQGTKLVFATRESRGDQAWVKITSGSFHRLIHTLINPRYPKGGFDFYVVDRQVMMDYLPLDRANVLSSLLLIWLGYDYKEIYYTRQKRTHGKSGYKFWKKVQMALSAFVSFSLFPIRFLNIIGVLCAGFGCVAGIIDILLKVCGVINYPVTVDIFIMLSFFAGILLLGMSILAEYIWRMFDVVKGQPRYLVDEKND